MSKKDLRSMRIEELTEAAVISGEPPYRGRQLEQWIHKRTVSSLDDMTSLPKAFRKRLADAFRMTTLNIVSVMTSKKDGTRKYLLRLPDGELIESVLLPYRFGNTVCVSTQVGCRMGCAFCASTIDGLRRNLTAAEMLEQVFCITRDTGERVKHIVVMGSGEPFDNYENLLSFLHLVTNKNGYGLSVRGITVSTCGVVPGIRRFAEEKTGCGLALSLHAPTQEARERLMPVTKAYPLDEVMAATDFFFAKTGRQVTYEYALIDGINDTEKDMKALIRLLAGRNAHVNLIGINPVKERNLRPSSKHTIEYIKNLLEKNGINVTIRREMGTDIDGACGQLRRRYLEGTNTLSC